MENKKQKNNSTKQKKIIMLILIIGILFFMVNKLGWSKIFNISKALILLGILIFVHELGHFLIAKVTKVPVYKFAIGMGSKIISKTIGETEYSLRIIPLGGFVQLELEEDLGSENGSLFRKLNPFKRFAVYSAGAIFNFIFAFILIVTILFVKSYPTTTIGEIFNNSSTKCDLKVGDEILSISGNSVNEWSDIPKLIESNTNQKLEIEIKRGSNIKEIELDLSKNYNDGKVTIGIAPKYEKNLIKSIVDGFKVTYLNITETTKSLIDALTSFLDPIISEVSILKGDTDKSEQNSDVELTGPIGTIDIISEQMNKGVLNYLSLMASISISLGVFNLLPIPGLDGGRMLLIILEILRGGKQLTIKQELNITMVGVFSILALMVLTTIKDITNLM